MHELLQQLLSARDTLAVILIVVPFIKYVWIAYFQVFSITCASFQMSCIAQNEAPTTYEVN